MIIRDFRRWDLKQPSEERLDLVRRQLSIIIDVDRADNLPKPLLVLVCLFLAVSPELGLDGLEDLCSLVGLVKV